MHKTQKQNKKQVKYHEEKKTFFQRFYIIFYIFFI